MKIFNRDVTIFGKLFHQKKTAIAVSGAVTLHANSGIVTTESLITAQNAIYTLTITNAQIKATDIVLVNVMLGTNSLGTPMLGTVTPADGSVVIKVINKDVAAVSFNGTLKIAFIAVGQAV